MIKNVPNPHELLVAGESQLNVAWDIIFNHVNEFEKWRDKEELCIDCVVKEEIDYWARLQNPIMTSLIVLFQGIEILLKYKISEISPYLLIETKQSKWKKTDKNDIDFDSFATVDTTSILNLYNGIYETPLSEEFNRIFHRFKDIRNKSMHLGAIVDLSHEEIVKCILLVHKELVGRYAWTKSRRRYLEGSAGLNLKRECKEGNIVNKINSEILYCLSKLKSEDANCFFGCACDDVLVICVKCFDTMLFELDDFFDVNAANNSFTAYITDAYGESVAECICCGHREFFDNTDKCLNPNCSGGLISTSTDICLSCGTCFSCPHVHNL